MSKRTTTRTVTGYAAGYGWDGRNNGWAEYMPGDGEDATNKADEAKGHRQRTFGPVIIGPRPLELYATPWEACEHVNRGGGWDEDVFITKVTRVETVEHVDLGGFASCGCAACQPEEPSR